MQSADGRIDDNCGVGRFDSPKYSRSTPSIDIAISPSSRIRV